MEERDEIVNGEMTSALYCGKRGKKKCQEDSMCCGNITVMDGEFLATLMDVMAK